MLLLRGMDLNSLLQLGPQALLRTLWAESAISRRTMVCGCVDEGMDMNDCVMREAQWLC